MQRGPARSSTMLLAAATVLVGLSVVGTPAQAASPPPGVIEHAAGYSPTEGPALSVGQQPYGVFAHGADVYVNDLEYCAVRYFNRVTGLETTIAAAESRYYSTCPTAIGIDATGRLYFSQDFSLFRRELDGQQVRIAGTGTEGHPGPADDGRPATDVALSKVSVATQAPAGTIYFVSGGIVGSIDLLGRYATAVRSDGSTAAGPGPYRTLLGIQSLAVTTDGVLHLAYGSPPFEIGAHHAGGLLALTPAGQLSDEADNCGGTPAEPAPALSACFASVNTISADGDSVLVADGAVVRRLRNGTLTTVAGKRPYYGGDQPVGVATDVRLGRGLFPAADGAGGFYIGDTINKRLLYVNALEIIASVAGDGTTGANGDGGPASAAQLNRPMGMATDRAGNVYVADHLANRVRVISPTGLIRTFAGSGAGGLPSGDGGPALAAAVFGPHVVATAPDGSVYIGSGPTHYEDDPTYYSDVTPPLVVRRVDPLGRISTVAGGGEQYQHLSAEGAPATDLKLDSLDAMTVGPDGSLYLAAANTHYYGPGTTIIRIDPEGRWHPFAGFGSTTGNYGDNGPALNASFERIWGLAFDSRGGMYVSSGDKVRYIRPDGAVVPFAGLYASTSKPPIGDGGPATRAVLSAPRTLALDDLDNVYIADIGNFRVRRVSPDGVITTVAGNGASTGPIVNGVPATTVALANPDSLAVVQDRLYIGEAGFHMGVRVVGLPRTPPGPPRDLTTTPTAEGFTVSWRPPADDGGSPITGYTVRVDGGGGNPLPAGATSYQAVGLVPGTQHTVVVVPFNALGAGSGATTTASVAAAPPVAIREGMFVRVPGTPTVYRIAGGAPIALSSWNGFGGAQPVTSIGPQQLDSLRPTPADGTFVRSTSGPVYRFAGGAPLYVSNWAAVGGNKPTITVDSVAIDRAGQVGAWSHVRPTPADGTFIRSNKGPVYRFIGGAPSHISNWSVVGGTKPTVGIDQASLDHAGQAGTWRFVRATPADGTYVRASTGPVYRFAGGAPVYVSNWAAVGGAQPTVDVDVAAMDKAGQAGVWRFARFHPTDNTRLRAGPSGGYFLVLGGHPRATGAGTATVVDPAAIANAGKGGLWKHLR